MRLYNFLWLNWTMRERTWACNCVTLNLFLHNAVEWWPTGNLHNITKRNHTHTPSLRGHKTIALRFSLQVVQTYSSAFVNWRHWLNTTDKKKTLFEHPISLILRPCLSHHPLHWNKKKKKKREERRGGVYLEGLLHRHFPVCWWRNRQAGRRTPQTEAWMKKTFVCWTPVIKSL